jgi:H+/Cl- antiporter ClcA
MHRKEKSREPGIVGALSTILLSILVGLFARSLGAAFHYSLLAAGAAAGLSAAFGAPFASILFVTEELRKRFSYTFVPIHAVALASLIAKVMDDQVFGMGPLLPIQLKISLVNYLRSKLRGIRKRRI